MPVYKVKPRVRFQGSRRKAKQDEGGKAQYEPTRTVFDGAPRSSLFSNMVDKTLFAKKRVLSTDELDDLVRSNLSSSLAAAKAYTAQQEGAEPPPSSACQHIERLQVEYSDSPTSLLELAPLLHTARDYTETTEHVAVVNQANHADDGPSASLLAITTIYAPLSDHRKQEVFASKTAPKTTATCDLEDHELPRTFPLAQTQGTDAPINDHEDSAEQPRADALSAAEPCAIEDIDENDDPPAFLSVETRESFVNHIKPVPRTLTTPIRIQKQQSTFLKWVVTIFAGRRRCRATQEGVPGELDQVEVHKESTTPHCSPHRPSVGSPCCSVETQDESADRTASSSSLCPPPSPRRATSHFARATVRKSLPVPPPIVFPPQQRPYRPFEERLDQPVIEPAKEHRFTGTYYVAPDVFIPAEVRFGFPRSLMGPISHVRQQSSDSKLLDRGETTWGKWYAKYPNPGDLPFAAAYNGSAEEVTEQDVCDSHAAHHAKFRKTPPPPMSDKELSRRLDDDEHERAARLRYHTGHCFGALTGDCYPLQGGLII